MTKEELAQNYANGKAEEFEAAISKAYLDGFEQGIQESKPKEEDLPLTIFRLKPHGYYHNHDNFVFWASINNGNVEVSEDNRSGYKIICRTLMDDYNNGGAEFFVYNFCVNDWRFEYARTSWSWNNSEGVALFNSDFFPVPVKKKFPFGIAQHGLKELCRRHINYLLSDVYKNMKRCESPKEYIEDWLLK